jgi:DMSO/TMAO reductase YedYZ molybdopterin-dependent catalytic subunit
MDHISVRERSGMEQIRGTLSRRSALKILGAAGGGAVLASGAGTTLVFAEAPDGAKSLESFTGPGPNRHWNSVGPYVTEPQKAPLILLTDRPVQLETPRHYFRTILTPNEAFYVRWHLAEIPNGVDLGEWKLRVEGNVNKPVAFSLSDLMQKFKPVSVAAVNQCSGNSRSRLQPRVPGGQWGNGAMGNAMWTGVRLRELLDAAGVKSGSLQVQFEGLETGAGPKGLGSNRFMKSLDLTNPALDESIVAYLMNGEPLPMLNGFPMRLVVPGYFATYWTKSLSWIRVLEAEDDNFWMKTAYRIPDTARGTTTPEDMKAGKVKTIPIERMPVRSFLVSPDGSSKIPAGLGVTLCGIAFSGYGKVVKVEVSDDGGSSWKAAELGEDHGAYSFRGWQAAWTPKTPGRYSIAVRATDEKGNVQPDEPVWNPGGYLWNKIERQELVAGKAS